MAPLRRVTSPNETKKKSILKKSDSSSSRNHGNGGHRGPSSSTSSSHPDPEMENLLMSGESSMNPTPVVARRPMPPLLNRANILSSVAYYSHTHSNYGQPQKTDSSFFYREEEPKQAPAAEASPETARRPALPASVSERDAATRTNREMNASLPNVTSDILNDQGNGSVRPASKDMQTSTTTLAAAMAAAAQARSKFERGRDPSHTAPTANRDNSNSSTLRDDSGQ